MPATELQQSFLFIVGLIQHQTYCKEIYCLQNGKVLSADLQRLTPFLSESAIGTRTVTLFRLENAQAKYPLLLPKDHKGSNVVRNCPLLSLQASFAGPDHGVTSC